MATAQPTTDHDVIRNWVEDRGGNPARVRESGSGNDPGILRIDFPGFSGEGTLESIEWDEFFEWFDRNDLALILSEEDGNRFNKLVSRETVKAGAGPRKSTATSRNGSTRTASAGSSKKSTSKKSASAKKAGGAKKGGAKKAGSAKKAGAKRSSAKASSPSRKAASAKKSGGSGRASSKKASSKRVTSSKKAAPRKATAKKAAPRKAAAKKAAPRQAAAKESSKQRTSSSKSGTRAPSGKSSARKRPATKKGGAVARIIRAVTGLAKGTSKKSVAKKGASKKAVPRKATSKTASAKSRSTGASSTTTTNHDEIRKWVEARGGFPAHVKRTGNRRNDPGVLRIDYPGYSGTATLERMDWDDWFEAFDANELAFVYQKKRNSRFSKLIAR